MKTYRVPRDLVRLGIAAVLLVVAFLGSAATQLFHSAEVSLEHHKLVQKTALLESELAGLETRFDASPVTQNALTSPDDSYRIIAGLTPVNAIASRTAALPVPERTGAESSVKLNPVAASTAFGASMDVDQLLQRARLLAFGWREAGDELRRKYDEFANTPSILPTSGYIASSFSRNRRHPILGITRPHLGLDIVAPTGTPVVAAANGRVSFVGRRSGFGTVVEIEHGSGRTTRYAHLSRASVRVGQRVERNDRIGNVGATGLAAAPHLHYEVILNGRQANPRTYILDGDRIPD